MGRQSSGVAMYWDRSRTPCMRKSSTAHATVTTRAGNSTFRSTALSLLVFVHDLEPGDHARVGERGDVADRLAVRDVAEEAAHDLPGSRLRQIGRQDDLVRPCDLADLLHDVFLQVVDLGGAAVESLA